MYFELCLWFEGNYNQIKQKTKAKWETIIKKYNKNAVSFVVFKGENWIRGGEEEVLCADCTLPLPSRSFKAMKMGVLIILYPLIIINVHALNSPKSGVKVLCM